MSDLIETIEYLEEITEACCVVDPEMCLDRITYAVVELKKQQARIEKLEKDNENLEYANDFCGATIKRQDKRIEELETAFKELRKALKGDDD